MTRERLLGKLCATKDSSELQGWGESREVHFLTQPGARTNSGGQAGRRAFAERITRIRQAGPPEVTIDKPQAADFGNRKYRAEQLEKKRQDSPVRGAAEVREKGFVWKRDATTLYGSRGFFFSVCDSEKSKK